MSTCPVCQSKVNDEDEVCPYCNFKLLGKTMQFKPVLHEEPKVESEAKADNPVLRMMRGPQIGLEYPLDKDVISIGRNPQCDIFLNDMTVSRKHADIIKMNGAYVIRDAKSYNGVWINNCTVANHTLRPGDYIQIGRFDFVFDMNSQNG